MHSTVQIRYNYPHYYPLPLPKAASLAGVEDPMHTPSSQDPGKSISTPFQEVFVLEIVLEWILLVFLVLLQLLVVVSFFLHLIFFLLQVGCVSWKMMRRKTAKAAYILAM